MMALLQSYFEERIVGNSFQDQLLKVGLIDDKKVKQTKKESYKKQKQSKNKPAVDPNKLAAQQKQAEQVKRDRELNRQRQEAMQQKAIAAQIKQLIEVSCQSREGGESPYNFSDQGKIHKIYVTSEQHRQLVKGRLAIVKLGDRYELVPAAAAEKIRQRDAACIIVLNSAQQQEDDGDDPYADYQVPDDLMW
jgi:hypothetical protein